MKKASLLFQNEFFVVFRFGNWYNSFTATTTTMQFETRMRKMASSEIFSNQLKNLTAKILKASNFVVIHVKHRQL